MSPSPDDTVNPTEPQQLESGTPSRVEAPDTLLDFMLRKGLTQWFFADDYRTCWIMCIEGAPQTFAKSGPELTNETTLEQYAADLARSSGEGQ